MKALAVVAAAALGGCSFVGADVPDHPRASAQCPEGVIVVDIMGTALFLVPATVWFVEGLRGNTSNSFPTPSPLLLSLPAAAIGALYLTSTMYGFGERRRCQRLKSAPAAPP